MKSRLEVKAKETSDQMNVIKQQITHEFANLRQRIERKERELDYNIESSGNEFAS